MKLSKYDVLSVLLIVFIVVVSIFVYPHLPQEVPSHWNVEGEVDGWMSSLTIIILFPAIIAGLYLLLLFIPKIAVYKKHMADFKIYFEGLKFLFVLFFSAIYLSTLFVALDMIDSIMPVLVVGLAFLFFYIGYVLQFVKKNYFIGIRTPWTLASSRSWKKTHRLASILFRVGGVLFLVGIVSPRILFWLVIVFVVLVVFGLMTYSYIIFKQEN